MEILFIFLIALSLSADAFSLSIAYGILNIKKNKIIITSLIVGIFHFIMPLLGYFLGTKISLILKLNPKYILSFVLILIMIETIKSINEEKEIKELNYNYISIILFALFVSIDSFTVGIGIKTITSNLILPPSIFAFISFLLTYLGFNLGKYISKKSERISKYIAIFILFSMSIYVLF